MHYILYAIYTIHHMYTSVHTGQKKPHSIDWILLFLFLLSAINVLVIMCVSTLCIYVCIEMHRVRDWNVKQNDNRPVVHLSTNGILHTINPCAFLSMNSYLFVYIVYAIAAVVVAVLFLFLLILNTKIIHYVLYLLYI